MEVKRASLLKAYDCERLLMKDLHLRLRITSSARFIFLQSLDSSLLLWR